MRHSVDAVFVDPGFGWSGANGHEAADKSYVTLSSGGRTLKTQNRTTWGSLDTADFEYKLPKKGHIPLEQQRQSPDSTYATATAETVTATASFDIGATWKSVPVKKVDGTWKASVVTVKSGFVGLKALVQTTAGYKTEVVVYRAYRVG